MEGYGGSNMTVMIQNDTLPCSSEVIESLWISNSSPSFHGDSLSCSTSMVNLEDVKGGKTTRTPFFPPLEKEENDNEDYDGSSHQPEKKRRLTADQVQYLERSFEVENKLEPERKVELAKEIGLQPRQVAIWFQNRRARFKTKQLEKDYGGLKTSYDRLKADYERLLMEKERLKNEVHLLTEKLLIRQKGSTNSDSPDFPINPAVAELQKQIPNAAHENKSDAPIMVLCKQEDASSAKSDVSDSDSRHCTDVNHSPLLEPADSCHGLGPEQSDFSQDDEEELTRSLFPKLEDECYNDTPANGFSWNFTVEGQPSWLWPY